jgi:hypothetical protein
MEAGPDLASWGGQAVARHGRSLVRGGLAELPLALQLSRPLTRDRGVLAQWPDPPGTACCSPHPPAEALPPDVRRRGVLQRPADVRVPARGPRRLVAGLSGGADQSKAGRPFPVDERASFGRWVEVPVDGDAASVHPTGPSAYAAAKRPDRDGPRRRRAARGGLRRK